MGLFQLLLQGAMIMCLIGSTKGNPNTTEIPLSVIRPIATHIVQDGFTAKLIKQIFGSNLSPEFRFYINLGLNNMLTMNEFYKSLTKDEETVKIPEAMDAFNMEKFFLQQTHEGKENQVEEETLDEDYWNGIVSQLQTSLHKFGGYKGDFLASENNEEDIFRKFTYGKLLPIIRKSTINGLISRYLGTLESSNYGDVFNKFNDDSIYFTETFWRNMLQMYQSEDRTFVSDQMMYFLIFRTSLQNLAQIRLTRILLSEHNQDVAIRFQAMNDRLGSIQNQISSLDLESGPSGYACPQETQQCDCSQSNLSDQPLSSTVIQQCPSINDQIKRHLKICPSNLQMPSELRNLASEFRSISTTLTKMHLVLNKMGSSRLLTEFQASSTMIENELTDISNTLGEFSESFNSTTRFFKSIDNTISSIYSLYDTYQKPIKFLLYAILTTIGLVLSIQLILLLIKIPECCKFVSQYTQDFYEFRQQRNNQRAQQDEINMAPLLRQAHN